MKKQGPRQVSLQLDAEMANMLDAVMVSHGHMSTPTQIARSCLEVGLIRLCVASAQSPLVDTSAPAKEALADVHRSRVVSACSALKP